MTQKKFNTKITPRIKLIAKYLKESAEIKLTKEDKEFFNNVLKTIRSEAYGEGYLDGYNESE